MSSFKELIAWQKARNLTKAIYLATRTTGWAHDYGLSGQIQRAAVSIMSNIAEGHERGSLPEFHNFLRIAKASCAEVRSQLYVALDVGYIGCREFESLVEQANEVSRLIGGLRASIERRRDAANVAERPQTSKLEPQT